MQDMLAVMVNDPVAAAAGLAAMVCLAIWPLFRARPTMLMVYIGNNLGFVAHYALLGDRTAAAMNGLLAVQTFVAIWLVRRPRLRWVYYALMPALAGTSFVTWQGLPSFLAAAAATLSTIGRMQANEIVLRALLLASTPFWAAHDLAVGSLPGLTADLLSMTTGASMLLQRSPAARSTLARAKEQLWRRASAPSSALVTVSSATRFAFAEMMPKCVAPIPTACTPGPTVEFRRRTRETGIE